MTLQSSLTATVNHFIQELKLSESDVAERCGLCISTVRRVTRGTGKYTTPSAALKLMQGIGISVEHFMDKLTYYQSMPDESIDSTEILV